MKFIRHTLDFQIPEECVVSLGKFDGLHLGHKYLLQELKKGKEIQNRIIREKKELDEQIQREEMGLK